MSWQNQIRDWLGRAAEARLREAMAGKQEGTGPDSDQSAIPADPPAHLGIVMCEHREAVGLIDQLDGLLTITADRVRVYEGGMRGWRLAVVVCGKTPEEISAASEVVIDGHRPGWLLATGFSTALTAALASGDLLLAQEVVSSTGKLATRAVESRKWEIGRLLTQAGVGEDQTERRRLADQYDAVAADSLAYWVAVTASKRDIPCAALTVVRHALDDQRSRDADRLRRKQSLSRRIGLLTGIVLNRPGSLKKVWNEKEADLIAADRLADGIAALVDRLKEGT